MGRNVGVKLYVRETGRLSGLLLNASSSGGYVTMSATVPSAMGSVRSSRERRGGIIANIGVPREALVAKHHPHDTAGRHSDHTFADEDGSRSTASALGAYTHRFKLSGIMKACDTFAQASENMALKVIIHCGGR